LSRSWFGAIYGDEISSQQQDLNAIELRKSNNGLHWKETSMLRRELLRQGATGALFAVGRLGPSDTSQPGGANAITTVIFDVRSFGATGNGKTLDSPSINRAIDAAAAAGGGTIIFPAGVYASYTIRLKSHISLYLSAGATILAADVPPEGTASGGYDAAGPPQPWENYQDFGHNHWPNSLIYGDGLEGISIFGPGLIWGKGLSRGERNELPRAESPGVGNKAIALKNCRNVLFRDFSILMGGHFAILLTGVDNVLIDGLKIDTNRDGIDIDCCRNVSVSNCKINSPWDDAICPKSSFALGYARSTENVTIANCYVTGKYAYGTMLDGTYKPAIYSEKRKSIGRIKCGTESNGGFKSIAVSNCVMDGCRGFALETVDGAQIEDVTVTNITMRDMVHSPIFLRLGSRMRGPKGTPPGSLRRVILSNIVSHGAVAEYPSIIAGIPGAVVEDIKISDMYLQQTGGGGKEWAARQPPENVNGYPEADMFGILPACGFFLRNARNLEFSNIEIATEKEDARPAFWAENVDGFDCFRVRVGRSLAFSLSSVRDFRSFGSKDVADRATANSGQMQF
jgi:polygalacturonase